VPCGEPSPWRADGARSGSAAARPPAEYQRVERWLKPRRAPRRRARTAAAKRSRGGDGRPDSRGIYSTGHRFRATEFARRLARHTRPWRASRSPPWRRTAPVGPRRAPAISPLQPFGIGSHCRAQGRPIDGPRELPPGRYTVILEPAAVLDLTARCFPTSAPPPSATAAVF